MRDAKVYEQQIVLPTYGIGEEEKNPMFFEKRVYQGSSGKVYPYPVIEKISDEKTDKVYNAVVLENDWICVVVLPELGGRIYTARDKTNDYDFVYRNNVVKPALVGLLGPWISGGIEFNWPQHHRPTTFMPVNHLIKSYPDGSVSVFVGESEAMFSLKHTTEIKLYPDKSYIEIKTDVYNRGELPQTFLWWANPAFKVNDDTATIMPKDVTAVMDHGKRAVSTFPIATGEYYKMDYSAGVDISRYKNIPVPTSFMAYRSDFDFVGGYDYGKRAGLLHVADRHVSPGKKQWTWGCGDFGKAWDRNLTDGDGPYVELMTGCFTDNQPDFTFIAQHETKSFTQYFLPYHDVGQVLNADENVCFGTEDGVLTVYSSAYIDVEITVKENGCVTFEGKVSLSPTETAKIAPADNQAEIILAYRDKKLRFSPADIKKFDIPSAAEACPPPVKCATNEELFLYGTHVEQYRHATRRAEDYYLEGLKRDESDLRINNAYGLLLLRRGKLEQSIPYFKRAIAKATVKNPNPKDTEPFFNLGVAYFFTGKDDEAYGNFYKCLWGSEKAEAFYYLSVIDAIRGNLPLAVSHAVEAVLLNGRDTRAINSLGRLYGDTGEEENSVQQFLRARELDPLDVVACYEIQKRLISDLSKTSLPTDLADASLEHVSAAEIRIAVGDYLCERRYGEMQNFLEAWKTASNQNDALVELYVAYAKMKKNEDYASSICAAQREFARKPSFAINLSDLEVLTALDAVCQDYLIAYELGNLFYDKGESDLAAEYWTKSARLNPSFPTVKRNLALYSYNKKHDKDTAVRFMEEAYALDNSDARVLSELFELYTICGKSLQERYLLLSSNPEAVNARDDLYLEYLSLLAERGEAETSYTLMSQRKFHPWEGGEGKVTRLYKQLNIALAKRAEDAGDYSLAKSYLNNCLIFPDNLGEGKLILDFDNDVYYKLGALAEKFGHETDAREYYRMATRGKVDVADDMYYNDAPVDYIYYAALAYKKLGMKGEAEKIQTAFMRYHDTHVGKKNVIDYFAVSLPDMLVWEKDINERNTAFCRKLKSMSDSLRDSASNF